MPDQESQSLYCECTNAKFSHPSRGSRLLSFNKMGMAWELVVFQDRSRADYCSFSPLAPQVLQFLEDQLEEFGCLPAELLWRSARSHSCEDAHTGLGVLCGLSQPWQQIGKLEASRVREVTYSSPTFLEDRTQPTCQEEEHIAYCLRGVSLSAGGFALQWVDSKFSSWSLWEASLSVRNTDRKGHICWAEAASEVLVWRQALSTCF